MAKKIEKYRMILEADPGSMVFVELAKALIDASSFDEAIDVCHKGLENHPDSIVGHVLWGRALIGKGEPAEAMDEFDKAVALDPENPYAYNLIGEVLLHKQLYRSALPILRKAVSLQPGDVRVRQWLDQAERATGGDTQPVNADPTVMSQALASDPEPGASPWPEDPPGTGALDAAFDKVAQASDFLPAGAPTQVSEALDVPSALSTDKIQRPDEIPAAKGPQQEIEAAFFAAGGDAPGAPPTLSTGGTDPFAHAGGGAAPEDDAVISGLTSTFEALGAGADALPAMPEPGADPFAEAPADPDPTSLGITPGGPADNDPTLFSGPPPVPPPLPPKTPDEDPASTALFGLELPPDPKKRKKKKEPTSPKVQVQPVGDRTAQVIAAEYERELRAKMMPVDGPPQTFFRRHAKGLLISGAIVLTVGTASIATMYAHSANRAKAIKDGIAAARNGITHDTRASYVAALEALSKVRDLDAHNATAKVLTAQVDAILYADIDHDPKRRAEAEKLVADGKVAAADPDAALDARYHLAPKGERKVVGETILGAVKKRPKSGLLQYLAGEVLLADGKTKEATEHFQKALDDQSVMVRTLMAVGTYLAGEGRWQEALGNYFDRVRELVPGHVRAQIDAAEAKLETGSDLDGALTIVEQLDKDKKAKLLPWEQTKLDMVAGRILEAKGRHREAVVRLTKAVKAAPDDPKLAATLARIHFAHFELPDALHAVDAALGKHGTDPDLRMLEANILMAWSRYRDARSHLAPRSKDGAKVWLLAGIAAYHQGDYRHARRYFDKTRNKDGKMLADAAIYLALTDLASGDAKRAKVVLDRADHVRRHDALVEWALGRWYEAAGNHRAAIHQLGRAIATDKTLYRAYGDLATAEKARGRSGRAYADLGKAVAIDPYFREGQVALGEIQLERGEADPARATFQKVLADRPHDADANRGMALALLSLGKLDVAWQHALEARRRDRSNPKNYQALGEVALARGHSSSARRYLLVAHRLAPDDATILADLAWAYAARGRRGASQAKKYAKDALEADRHDAHAQWAYGHALMLLKDRAAMRELGRAAAMLRRAGRTHDEAGAYRDLANAYLTVPRKPDQRHAQSAAWHAVKAEDTAENRVLVGTILLDEGKPKVARAHFEKAISLEPDRAPAHFELGKALADMKDESGAKSALQDYLKLAPRGPHAREARKLLASLGS